MENIKRLPVFIGYDPRQSISLNVLSHSLHTKSSKPLSITPLVLNQLPIKRAGLTPFTYSRFLVPYLCNYEGWALFLDSDMLAMDDIAKLFELADDKYSVMVSKNIIKFEHSSLMLFNCAKCKILTPEYIERASGLLDLMWTYPDERGELPLDWNHLVGYDEPKDSPKILHYTQGVPGFAETSDCEYAGEWFREHQLMNGIGKWELLMGPSVHSVTLEDGTRIPKYKEKRIANAS